MVDANVWSQLAARFRSRWWINYQRPTRPPDRLRQSQDGTACCWWIDGMGGCHALA
jgi:hypothetical protein